MKVWINKSSHLIFSANKLSAWFLYEMQNWIEMGKYKKFCAGCAQK